MMVTGNFCSIFVVPTQFIVRSRHFRAHLIDDFYNGGDILRCGHFAQNYSRFVYASGMGIKAYFTFSGL